MKTLDPFNTQNLFTGLKFKKIDMTRDILFTICFVFLFASCKKDTEDVPFVPISPEGMSYINLPINSYFIYKDPATGNQDSVVVYESVLSTHFSPARPSSYLSPGSSAYNYESYYLV